MKRKINDQLSNIQPPPLPNSNISNINSNSVVLSNAVGNNALPTSTPSNELLLKLLDPTAFKNQLKELFQEKIRSDSESSDDEDIKYYSLVPIEVAKPPGTNKDSGDANTSSNNVEPLLNDNSCSTSTSDDILKPHSQVIGSKTKYTSLVVSSSVSLTSSAPASINGSVTTKTSSSYASSTNSLISDDDSITFHFHASDNDDELNDLDRNDDVDSDPDLSLPLSDVEIAQFCGINQLFASRISISPQGTIDFINALHSASKLARQANPSKPQLSDRTLHSKKRKKLSATKAEQTLAGALSTFKTPLLATSVLSVKSKPSKRGAEPDKNILKSPKRRRRKKETDNKSDDDETTNISDQVLDGNTAHSTLSMDSYFIDERETLLVSSKARSAGSTGSLDNKATTTRNAKQNLKRKAKSQKILEQLNLRRKSIYISICKIEIPKAFKRREKNLEHKFTMLKRNAELTKRTPNLSNKVKMSPDKRPAEITRNQNFEPNQVNMTLPDDDGDVQGFSSLTFHSESEVAEPEVANQEDGHGMLKRIDNVLHFQLSSKQKLILTDICEATMSPHIKSETTRKHTSTFLKRFRKALNHPILLQKDDIQSPFRQKITDHMPRLLIDNSSSSSDRKHLLANRFCIYHPADIQKSLYHRIQIDDLNLPNSVSSEWSFLRFIDQPLSVFYNVYFGRFSYSLSQVTEFIRKSELTCHQKTWHNDVDLSCTSMLLVHKRVYQAAKLVDGIVFVDPVSDISGVLKHEIYSMDSVEMKSSHLLPSEFPQFLYCVYSKVLTERRVEKFICASPLSDLESELSLPRNYHSQFLSQIFPQEPTLMEIRAKPDWSGPKISMAALSGSFLDSGKLCIMDRLLKKWEADDHKCVIYCHMTRMIRILENYLSKRKWKFVKLDNSWPTESGFPSDSCLIYLVSRKSNLESLSIASANTVIFYDFELSSTAKQREEAVINMLNREKSEITIYRLMGNTLIEEAVFQKIQETSDQSIVHFKVNEVLSLLQDSYKKQGVHVGLQLKGIPRSESSLVHQTEYDVTSSFIEESDSSESDAGAETKIQEQEFLSNDRVNGLRESLHMDEFGKADGLHSVFVTKALKVGRGTGKRGRPPIRLRCKPRLDYDGGIGRRPGRPRLKQSGPKNQGNRGRGRRPGRPRKAEASVSSLPSDIAYEISRQDRSITCEDSNATDSFS